MANNIQTEILKDENEDALKDEVNEFLDTLPESNVKLTWQACFDDMGDPTMYICFIEHKRV